MIEQDSGKRGRHLKSEVLGRGIELPRVLVLDWNADLRGATAATVGEAGFQATSCTTPAEARQLISANEFQALLFDASLYGEDISSFLDWLIALGAKRPYVIALVDEDLAPECTDWLARGVDDVLTKPAPPEALRSRLAVMESRIGERRRSADELATMRRSLGRYEALFLEAPDAVLVLKNRQGKVIGVNRAVRDVLGYDGKALLGKYMSLVFPDIFGRDGLASRGDVLSGATVLHAVPYRRPDGEARTLDIVMSAVPWDSGYAVMMVCRDVSGREGSEASRARGSKDEALRRFASGVSGEFGDILTSLGGNLSLLSGAPFLNEDSRETLELAQDACERGRELISELTKIGVAARVPRKVPMDLPGVVQKTVQFALFDYEKIRPVFRVDEDLASFEGDESLIRMLVEAIAQNAAEALEDAELDGQLFVEATNYNVAGITELPLQRGSYIRLRFRDNGGGVSDGDAGRIFDPYYTGQPGSRGFGLTRAGAAARAHGGHLRLISLPGEGACFEVYLPAQPTGLEVGKAEAKPQGLRVLVLDDEPHILSMLEKALGSAGHEVFCASNGEDAYRAFVKAEDFGRPFDVLLFDLDIRGGMGGRETLERIRASRPKVKAIVTTGYVDDVVLENYLEHGFSGVLCKPFRLEHLAAAVERLGRA